jgi:hypothetical protein
MKEVIPQQFPQHRIQCTKTKKLLQSRGSTWLSGGAYGSLGEMHVRRKKKDWDGSKPLFLAIFFGNEISMSHRFLNSLGYRVLSQRRGVKTKLLQHWADSTSQHWWTVWQVLLATFVGCEETSLPGIAPIAPWFFVQNWMEILLSDGPLGLVQNTWRCPVDPHMIHEINMVFER